MKTLKRPLSILLSVLMVVSLFTVVPITASADEEDALDYFVVGDFSEWQTDNMYKMTLNTEAVGTEYVLTDMVLEPTYGMKVKDSAGTWYPDPADNYSVAASDTYTIYFRPNYDGGDDWYHKCLLAIKQEEPAPANPDQEAADAVTALINALPANIDDITLDNKSAIYDAYNAYEALTNAQKDLVSDDDVNKLTAAKDRVDDLQVVEGFVTMVSAIPNPVTLNDENTVNLIKTVYDALTDAQKALVPAEELAKLTDALDSIANQKAAKPVTDQINALPAQITLDAKTDVAAAREAYDALTDAQKAFVPAAAVAKLTAAEKTIEDAEAAANATALIDAIPANVTPADADKVISARDAYDALTPEQKALVSADSVAKLEAAEKSVADQIAAADVVALINAIPDEVTAADVDAIEAAKEGYDALTDDQKALIDDALVTKLDDAVAKIADLVAAAAVSEMIKALPSVETVTAEVANQVDAAIAAYDALTDAQKELVPDADVEKLNDLKQKLDDIEVVAAFSLLVNMLPEEIDLDDEPAVNFVRRTYDGLTDSQKDMVAAEDLAKLTEAETIINDIKAAAAVTDAINELPFVIRLDDKEAVEAARAAYDALTDDQKAYVDDITLEVLTDAEQVIADQEAAAAVSEMIEALPGATKITVNDKEAVDEAAAAYDALTDDQKNYVSLVNKLKLTFAKGALDAAEVTAADEAAADAVEAMIEALPDVDNVTLEDEAAINEAQAAYDALTNAQKRLVVLADRVKLANDVDTLKAIKDEAAADAVEALIEALPNAANVTIDDKAAIDEAAAAYDALTNAQKRLVDSADRIKLAAVVEALRYIEDEIAADAVEEMIKALPAARSVTIDDKAAIEEVRTAYDALTGAQKRHVALSDRVKLANVEAALAQIENDIAAAQAVIDMINALPAKEEVTLDDAEDIFATKFAFDKLTDDQKDLIDYDTAAKMYDDLYALRQLVAAKVVEDVINALPEELTIADKPAVEAVRAAYEALTDEQKALVDPDVLQKLVDAEAAIEKIENDMEAALAVSVLIEALPSPAEVTVDDKEAIEYAQAAYDDLTDDEKAYVSYVNKVKLAMDASVLKQIEEDIAAAAVVSALIEALPAVEDITYADKDAIEAAKAAFDDLTFFQKVRVGAENYRKLVDAVERLESFVFLGDANSDGKITVADITAIQRHISEIQPLTGKAFNAADVNRDGVVTIDDATVLQMFLAEEEVEFPIGEMV